MIRLLLTGLGLLTLARWWAGSEIGQSDPAEKQTDPAGGDPIPPDAVVHQVAGPNQTLPMIAAEFYGEERAWPLIYDKNTSRIPVPFDKLRAQPGALLFEEWWPGTILWIPEVESPEQWEAAKSRAISG